MCVWKTFPLDRQTYYPLHHHSGEIKTEEEKNLIGSEIYIYIISKARKIQATVVENHHPEVRPNDLRSQRAPFCSERRPSPSLHTFARHHTSQQQLGRAFRVLCCVASTRHTFTPYLHRKHAHTHTQTNSKCANNNTVIIVIIIDDDDDNEFTHECTFCDRIGCSIITSRFRRATKSIHHFSALIYLSSGIVTVNRNRTFLHTNIALWFS